MATSASTTITFAVIGAGEDGDISVELDDDANGGKSQFQSGDTVHFLIHTIPSNLNVEVDTTLGSVASNGTKSVPVEETLTFVQSKEETLSKIPNGTVTTAWVGRSGGTPTVADQRVTIPSITNGVLSCAYSTTAKAWKLSGVTIPTGMTEIQVLIVVTAAAA